MTAYDSIFYSEPYILATLSAIILISVLVFRSSFIVRSILFSFQFWLSPLFYISYIALTQRASIWILASLFIETLILFIYLGSFHVLLSIVRNADKFNIHRLTYWVKMAIFLEIVLVIPPILHGGYGIFSHSGLRNEYLTDSRINDYLTYVSILIQTMMVPIVAIIINYRKQWSKPAVIYILSTLALSVISGSKGGGLLSIFAILSLLSIKGNANYMKLIRLPLIALFMLFGLTVYYVGNFMHADAGETIAIMYTRLFYGSDGRALAIDYTGHLNGCSTTLFRESFRFLSSLLGRPPVNPIIGTWLFMQMDSVQSGVGANPSSTSLLIAYGGDYERLIFSIGICFTAIIIFIVIRMHSKYSVILTTLGIMQLFNLSQDFSAFQVCMNILIAVGVVSFIYLLTRNMMAKASSRQSTFISIY